MTPPLSGKLWLLPHSVTCDGCAQYLHCLHAGVCGQCKTIGVLLAVTVNAVCLRCLTSVAEHVDETVARGD